MPSVDLIKDTKVWGVVDIYISGGGCSINTYSNVYIFDHVNILPSTTKVE